MREAVGDFSRMGAEDLAARLGEMMLRTDMEDRQRIFGSAAPSSNLGRPDGRPKSSLSLSSSSTSSSLSDASLALHALLLEKRKEIGNRTNRLPFHIIGNEALLALAESPVTTLEEFGKIRGVGAVRAQQYGEDFTSVVRLHQTCVLDGHFGEAARCALLLQRGLDLNPSEWAVDRRKPPSNLPLLVALWVIQAPAWTYMTTSV